MLKLTFIHLCHQQADYKSQTQLPLSSNPASRQECNGQQPTCSRPSATYDLKTGQRVAWSGPQHKHSAGVAASGNNIYAGKDGIAVYRYDRQSGNCSQNSGNGWPELRKNRPSSGSFGDSRLNIAREVGLPLTRTERPLSAQQPEKKCFQPRTARSKWHPLGGRDDIGHA
jgi:predicted lipoprotein with Yx(FWY)xxD motif